MRAWNSNSNEKDLCKLNSVQFSSVHLSLCIAPICGLALVANTFFDVLIYTSWELYSSAVVSVLIKGIQQNAAM